MTVCMVSDGGMGAVIVDNGEHAPKDSVCVDCGGQTKLRFRLNGQFYTLLR